MASPFNLDSFLADIDQRFDLDNDVVQEQAAANENNNAELADLGNTQLGDLDQVPVTETNTMAGDGGDGGVAVGGDSGSADGTGVGGDGGSITLDGKQNVNFGDSYGGAGIGVGGTTGDGGNASADGGDGGSNDVDVDVDAEADQDFDSDQDVDQEADQDGTNVLDADADDRHDTDIDNDSDMEDESELRDRLTRRPRPGTVPGRGSPVPTERKKPWWPSPTSSTSCSA